MRSCVCVFVCCSTGLIVGWVTKSRCQRGYMQTNQLTGSELSTRHSMGGRGRKGGGGTRQRERCVSERTDMPARFNSPCAAEWVLNYIHAFTMRSFRERNVNRWHSCAHTHTAMTTNQQQQQKKARRQCNHRVFTVGQNNTQRMPQITHRLRTLSK